MLKSEVQHQYWITKKAVQRKLGTKEDKHIISSDAELDAKIEVFKSIAETSADLSKIIDQYQERLCILSQEECVFGRFLKEVGKRSKTTGQSITNTGKAMSYAGQQRMCVRVPLLRLQHEVDVYRCRAVKDTENTLQAMEKERTEYRAALSWMKSASTELDPDTGKGLEKFRTAQTHVRAAKQNFDSYSMDSIQKIDLLAAARCNMYSHALVSYISELKQFAQKAASTFDTISKSLSLKPKYDFRVLKELTQNEGEPLPKDDEPIKPIETLDKDQSLFFASEYKDDNDSKSVESKSADASISIENSEVNNEALLIELSKQMEDISCSLLLDTQENTTQADNNMNNAESTVNSFWSRMFNHQQQQQLQQQPQQVSTPTTANHSAATTEYNTSNVNHKQQQQQQQQQLQQKANGNQMQKSTKPNNAWLELFADLDPFANPQAFDLQLSGGRANSQQT